MASKQNNKWVNKHHNQNITINADQAEIRALIENTASIRSGTADERIADALDDFDAQSNAEVEDWAKEDIQLDNADGATIEEIERRIHLMCDLYPFKLTGASLRYCPPANNSRLYEALLCISQANNLTTGKYKYLPRHFEFLSCIVSEIYLGSDSQSYRTGWPRGIGEPKRLKALVEKVRHISGNMMGEWNWNPKEGFPEDPSPRDAKECGVDIVAWKKSVDGRTGQLYLLGQCACGKNWIDDDKLAELRYKNIIGDWVESFPVEPVKVFFTPAHTKDDFMLHASRKSASVFFDRARIVLQAASSDKIRSGEVQLIIEKIIKTVQSDLA